MNQPAQLEHVALFSGLTPAQMNWVQERVYVRTFAQNVDIITAGTPGEMVFVILNGTIKVYVPQLDGRQVTVAILGPGETVGEMSLVDSAGRSASAITLEESVLLWMNRVHFKEAIESIPRFAQNLLSILTRRLRLSTEHIQALAALDVNGRIARQLLAFADHYGRKSDSGTITIPICLTQSEIAELVGASRKRVNQIMVAFKRYGWISIDNEYHITILNHKALAHLSARG